MDIVDIKPIPVSREREKSFEVIEKETNPLRKQKLHYSGWLKDMLGF